MDTLAPSTRRRVRRVVHPDTPPCGRFPRSRRPVAPPRLSHTRTPIAGTAAPQVKKNISNFGELTAALLFPIPQIAPRDDDDTERHKTNADATTADDVHGGGGGGGGKQQEAAAGVDAGLHMRSRTR